MPDKLQTSTVKLLEARRRDEPEALAEALARHANELIRHARVEEARVELEEAVGIHRALEHSEDEARCMQMVASLCRLGGKVDEAVRWARDALELVDNAGPIAVATWSELGEIELARGDTAASATAFATALALGDSAGLGAAARAALLRKHAVALVNNGQHAEAALALNTAHDILTGIGDQTNALRTLIELATTLHYAGEAEKCAVLVRHIIDVAPGLPDYAALADIQLLVAAQGFEKNDPAAALAASYAASEAALRAIVPATYFAASVSASRAANALGDQPEAYRVLATAWVTLADAIGSDAARAWVSPVLSALQTEWGEQVFSDVRARHDAQRRAAMAQQA
ncbi:hypothetical protein VVD49_06440 [Uliginosibacterium sp. H3]|uniref:Tetratricopeptide repeat protein n=1 Tax=Uliginosibacterium silvisoli TaxID=3114758 RepID=A0ABU6K128_9RHOO|nr:hypothetical protein [Uliginosibacterium sp. H3]